MLEERSKEIQQFYKDHLNSCLKLMLQINFTNQMIFSFAPPNISLLGTETDFDLLAKLIIDLTNFEGKEMEITSLDFVQNINENVKVIFRNEKNANQLACFDNLGNLRFTLDESYWDRLFRFFILLSWKKSTFYLNQNEEALSDLSLHQECNFICSSEF